MRKFFASILLTAALVSSAAGCSNWNKMTPKSMDNSAIETEIRKNMAADGITGVHIDVSDGVVTLSGDVPSSADRQKALDDAKKVRGVTRVVNNIQIQQ